MNKKSKPFFLDGDDYKRLFFVAFFIFLLFCFLIGQFYKVQIMEGDKWTKHAHAQHEYQMIEPFMRGRFISNSSIIKNHLDEGTPFVIDVAKFHLYIDPESIPEEEKSILASKITSFFPLSLDEKNKMIKEFYKKSRSRKLMMWLDPEKKDQIENFWYKFAKERKIEKNALFFVCDYQRSHPFGSLLGPVLHTVQDQKQNYQALPTGGLELYFDKYLQGKNGIKEVIRSPKTSLDTSNVVQRKENGADIYLTINHYLQAIVEEELEKGVKKANAKGGWAVMMDPKTGEILALGQYPFFDVNDYAKYFNDPLLQEHTKVKALTDNFEPGSIFKPITLAICFKANEELKKRKKPPILIPSEMIPTNRGAFPGRNKPIKDVRTHRCLNMDMAIQKSSSVYVALLAKRLVEKMGDEWYKNALHEFGFGEKTRIELPGESPGLVPTPGKLHPNQTAEWSVATPFSLAMGYNILVNSVQIARAYCIIANLGVDVEPTLLRKIVRKGEKGEDVIILDNTNKNKLQKRVLSSECAEQIIKAMKFTTKRGGTAPSADIVGYTEAGKTGTAEKIINGQYSKDLHISSFAGFAPVNNPRFVLIISIDEPEKKYIEGLGKGWMGGVCAAPIFKEIGTRTLQYLGVEPDDPFSYSNDKSDFSKADYAIEVNRLRDLYKKWNE